MVPNMPSASPRSAAHCSGRPVRLPPLASHRQAANLRHISAVQLEAALGTTPQPLGSGGFGTVFRGTLDGSPVA
eukprot:jgi/Tetstr1/454551/TSEL_041447.t1